MTDFELDPYIDGQKSRGFTSTDPETIGRIMLYEGNAYLTVSKPWNLDFILPEKLTPPQLAENDLMLQVLEMRFPGINLLLITHLNPTQAY